MAGREFIVRVDGVSGAEADRAAAQLRAAIGESGEDVEVRRQREDAGHQDFGATLVVLLGTPAAIAAARSLPAIAKSIKDWALRKGCTIAIETAGRRVLVRDVASKDVAEIVRAISAG